MTTTKHYNAIGIDDAANAVAAIGATVAGIVDAGKRRRAEQAIASLSAEQQLELNKKIAAQTSQDARMSVLINALVQYQIANDASQSKSDNIKLIVSAAVGIAAVGFLIWGLKKS